MFQSLRAGFIAIIPVSVGVAMYGSILGVLAGQKGIAWWELLTMNFMVFAGASQFVIVDMWGISVSVVEVAFAVAVINLRYLLMGAALHELFAGTSLFHKVTYIHLMADENWALTMSHKRERAVDTSFLLGGGLCILTTWCAGTMFGHRLGAAVSNPEAYAMDFVFLAMFLALAVTMWRGKQDLMPWVITIVLSILLERFLPGKWYIVIASMGGALVAATFTGEQELEKSEEPGALP